MPATIYPAFVVPTAVTEEGRNNESPYTKFDTVMFL